MAGRGWNHNSGGYPNYDLCEKTLVWIAISFIGLAVLGVLYIFTIGVWRL